MYGTDKIKRHVGLTIYNSRYYLSLALRLRTNNGLFCLDLYLHNCTVPFLWIISLGHRPLPFLHLVKRCHSRSWKTQLHQDPCCCEGISDCQIHGLIWILAAVFTGQAATPAWGPTAQVLHTRLLVTVCWEVGVRAFQVVLCQNQGWIVFIPLWRAAGWEWFQVVAVLLGSVS